MFKIALCDDNKPFLEFERNIISSYMTEKSVTFQCDLYLSGYDLISIGDAIRQYDLFILDYDLDGLNGFETANKIYEIYPEARIAFATNYYDFTREGYRYNAVRYLVKQETTFKSELLECIEYVLKTKIKKTILLELSDGIVEVGIDDILYIVSDKHYIEYFINKDGPTNYIKRCSLDDAQKDLPGTFVRVHQRYVVNMKTATQIKRNKIIVKKSGEGYLEIPIARNRLDEVNRKFCLIKGDIG